MERRLRANGLVFLLLSFVQADYKATLAAGAHLRNESKRFALREGRKSKPFMEKTRRARQRRRSPPRFVPLIFFLLDAFLSLIQLAKNCVRPNSVYKTGHGAY
jgi:hypothetical protein